MSEALLIFKPDAAYRLAARAGIWGWLSTERGWKIRSLEWFQPPSSLIEGHYDFLQGRPFFPWLVDFMTALPLIVGRVTASPETLQQMRYDLGETRIAQSRPGSLRELYGIFGGLNCLHLSDGPESGEAEVKRWADLDDSTDKPDHTFHLRSLAMQVNSKIHIEPATDAIKTLLADESDLDGNELEALYRITLGGLA